MTEQKFTDYQIDFAKTYHVNPAFAPVSPEALTLDGVHFTGLNRAPAEVTRRAPTVEEQRAELASIYGLNPRHIELPEAENEAAALDERRMARRAELQQKYGCPRPEDIPLEWLSDVT